MHPITLCSVVAVAVVFYKLLQYRSLQLDVRDFFGKVRQELLNGRVKEAGGLCERRRGPVSSPHGLPRANPQLHSKGHQVRLAGQGVGDAV